MYCLSQRFRHRPTYKLAGLALCNYLIVVVLNQGGGEWEVFLTHDAAKKTLVFPRPSLSKTKPRKSFSRQILSLDKPGGIDNRRDGRSFVCFICFLGENVGFYSK